MFIIDIIKNGIDIIVGYSIWFFDKITRHTNKMASARMKICHECKYNKHGVCELCGCVLEAKTRVDFELDKDGISIDGCPERKW